MIEFFKTLKNLFDEIVEYISDLLIESIDKVRVYELYGVYFDLYESSNLLLVLIIWLIQITVLFFLFYFLFKIYKRYKTRNILMPVKELHKRFLNRNNLNIKQKIKELKKIEDKLLVKGEKVTTDAVITTYLMQHPNYKKIINEDGEIVLDLRKEIIDLQDKKESIDLKSKKTFSR